MAEDRDIQLKDLDPFSYQVFSSYCQKFKIFFPEYTTEQIFKLWIKKETSDNKLFTGGAEVKECPECHVELKRDDPYFVCPKCKEAYTKKELKDIQEEDFFDEDLRIWLEARNHK